MSSCNNCSIYKINVQRKCKKCKALIMFNPKLNTETDLTNINCKHCELFKDMTSDKGIYYNSCWCEGTPEGCGNIQEIRKTIK